MTLLIAVCLGIIALAYIALGNVSDVADKYVDLFLEYKALSRLSLSVDRHISPAKLTLSKGSSGEKELFRQGIFDINNAMSEISREPALNSEEKDILKTLRAHVKEISVLAEKTFFSDPPANQQSKSAAARIIDWRLSDMNRLISKWRQIDQEEINTELQRSRQVHRTQVSLLLGSLAILSIGVIIALLFARFIFEPILNLHKGIERVSQGDASYVVQIKTGDEIQDLADAFNHLISNFRQEEQTASDIQRRLLPQKELRVPGVQVYASQTHAKVVGGDWFDYYQVEEEIRLLIADASGKGMPGALLATVGMSTIRSEPKYASTIESILHKTNRTIADRFSATDFITLLSAQLSLKNKRFVYINCGHEPPLYYDATKQQWTILTCPAGLPLGISIDIFDPEPQEMILNPGDKLILYTDGLHDVRNNKEQFLTMETIVEWLNHHQEKSLKHLTDGLMKKAIDYSDGPIIDDITLLGIAIS